VANPKADPGNLCVYIGIEGGLFLLAIQKPAAFEPGAGTTGASLFVGGGEVEASNVRGTFAVTAPEP
jgi:hypothetical protein